MTDKLPKSFGNAQKKKFKFKSIFVCLSSSKGRNPNDMELTQEVIDAMKERGTNLVYGGGEIGMMGALYHAAKRLGIKVRSVITEVFARMSGEMDPDIRVVETLHTRKQELIASADLTLILKGGIGTLDELFEVLAVNDMLRHEPTAGQIPIHPIIIVNTDGYYSHLLHQIAVTIDEGHSVNEKLRCLYVVDTVKEAFNLFDELEKTNQIFVESLKNEAYKPDGPESFGTMLENLKVTEIIDYMWEKFPLKLPNWLKNPLRPLGPDPEYSI